MIHTDKKANKLTKETNEMNWDGKFNSDKFFKTLEELKNSSISAAITRDEQKREGNERDK